MKYTIYDSTTRAVIRSGEVPDIDVQHQADVGESMVLGVLGKPGQTINAQGEPEGDPLPPNWWRNP